MDPVQLVSLILALLAGALVLGRLMHHQVPGGSALVVHGRGSRAKVYFGRALVLPLVQHAELLDISTKAIVLKRGRRNSLRCRDGVRVTLEATFLVKVRATPEEVLLAHRNISAKTLASAEARAELLVPSFSQALDVLTAQLDYDQLAHDLERMRDEVLKVIGVDLGGFCIEDLALTKLSMLPPAELDPNDPSEAAALRKLSEAAFIERTRVAELEREYARRVAQLEHELLELLIMLERQRHAVLFGLEQEHGLRIEPDKLRAKLDERLRELVSAVDA